MFSIILFVGLELTAANQFVPWIADEHNRMTMLTLAERKQFSQLEFYRNKPPRWNERLGCYSLNYHGRAKMISVKNFQLIRPTAADDVLLQVKFHLLIFLFLVSRILLFPWFSSGSSTMKSLFWISSIR
jgi:uncharacterized MAPEG superfamily protein